METTAPSGRFIKKSASLTNAVPFYCKRTNTVIYATDKVLFVHDCSASVFIYDKGFEIKRQLFENLPTSNKTTALNNHFVVSVCGGTLHVYWLKTKKAVRYELPVKGAQASKKQFTCVACHPKDAVIATGNVLGEVMVWWNFTMPFESDESTSLEDDDDDVTSETLMESSGHMEEFKLVNPKRVKRSVMHWHSREVTALAFTAEGKHLFSGGLEGVLVKWDLTECFGGVRQRRFFPLLGSPICGISSPGGESEETVVLTLENNSFLVLNGALQIIFEKSELCQTPRRWARHLLKPSIGVLPLSEPNETNDTPLHPEVLVNGSMGQLQVLDCATGTVTDQFNINRKPPVMCDGLTAPIFSEVQLAAVNSSYLPTATQWLVTYDVLQIPVDCASSTAGFSIDNQSRITWWKREKNVPATTAAPGGLGNHPPSPRQIGRLRDTRNKRDNNVSEQKEAALSDTTKKGILQLAEPIPDDRAAEGEEEASVTTIPRRYKREAVEEMESLLRQVSQYPVYAAPPPEQLLAQLFKKPHL
nr:unnamed protein product [Spirometra erinaceieuropaei]